MKRPSKKEMKEAVDRLKNSSPESAPRPYVAPPLQEKKANKNRIRKKGV